MRWFWGAGEGRRCEPVFPSAGTGAGGGPALRAALQQHLFGGIEVAVGLRVLGRHSNDAAKIRHSFAVASPLEVRRSSQLEDPRVSPAGGGAIEVFPGFFVTPEPQLRDSQVGPNLRCSASNGEGAFVVFDGLPVILPMGG